MTDQTFGEALEDSEQSVLVDQLYDQLEVVRKQLETEKRSRGRALRVIEETTRETISGLVIPPVPKPPKQTKLDDAGEEVAVVMIADIQLGKLTPDYNSEIAEARMEIYAEKVLKLIELQRKIAPINKVKVWLLGDTVEGEDIFPGQQWLIDSSLYAQAMQNAPRILSKFIRRLLASVDEVDAEGVIGNHGRQGRKGTYHPETNTDRMAYFVTKTILQPEIDAGRLTWEHAEPGNSGERGWYSVSHIGNYSCLLIHGDQFTGSLGVPWYGIQKMVPKWSVMGNDPKLPFEPFQDVAFGHWHQPMNWTINGIGVRCCGSPESYNDYALEQLAGAGRPSQRMMFVDPVGGHVTAEYPEVWLD